ncbi:MAG: hypothetical protein KGQ49_01700 [Verrucomicrobia bacterium]|nr:hypothetical protein [Verrucomicrobiota bacterium]
MSTTTPVPWEPTTWQEINGKINRYFTIQEPVRCGCLSLLDPYIPEEQRDQQRIVLVTVNNSSHLITEEASSWGRSASQRENCLTKQAILSFLQKINQDYGIGTSRLENSFPDFIRDFTQDMTAPVTIGNIKTIKKLYKDAQPQSSSTQHSSSKRSPQKKDISPQRSPQAEGISPQRSARTGGISPQRSARTGGISPQRSPQAGGGMLPASGIAWT